MNFFESIRRANEDFYTANPIKAMTDEQLASIAAEVGMTIDEFKEHAAKPHVEMSCPLCGRASTHVVNCKGCGGDAFGYEWELSHGPDSIDELKSRLRDVLADIATEEQLDAVAKHAYSMGGCMICGDCWSHTLPTEAFRTCPLFMLSESVTEPAMPPTALWMAQFNGEDAEAWRGRVRVHWTELWNTVEEQEQIAEWRGTILDAVFDAIPDGPSMMDYLEQWASDDQTD